LSDWNALCRGYCLNVSRKDFFCFLVFIGQNRDNLFLAHLEQSQSTSVRKNCDTNDFCFGIWNWFWAVLSAAENRRKNTNGTTILFSWWIQKLMDHNFEHNPILFNCSKNQQILCIKISQNWSLKIHFQFFTSQRDNIYLIQDNRFWNQAFHKYEVLLLTWIYCYEISFLTSHSRALAYRLSLIITHPLPWAFRITPILNISNRYCSPRLNITPSYQRPPSLVLQKHDRSPVFTHGLFPAPLDCCNNRKAPKQEQFLTSLIDCF